jgi:hypothetical protein
MFLDHRKTNGNKRILATRMAMKEVFMLDSKIRYDTIKVAILSPTFRA